MDLAKRALLFGVVLLMGLCGCNFDGSSSSGTAVGSGAAIVGGGSGGGTAGGGAGGSGSSGGAAAAPADNAVVATPSVMGTVAVVAGASQTVSVAFTSSDGRRITGFGLTGVVLPPGWSGPTQFSCPSVAAGNTCVLNLTYTAAAGQSGTLTLDYVYIDSASRAQTTGALNIDYAATVSNNVIATVSPIGQIAAHVGTGSESVSVNFTTDDGNAATGLTLSLAGLPAGWSSAASGLSCAVISSGSGCQVVLRYAPTAAASGVLTLDYGFTDDSGAAKGGSINIPYAATSGGNVVATVSPTGQINAVAGSGQQAVTVSFTTDDGQAAQNLSVFSEPGSPPAGWSSAAGFSCATLGTGNGCQLSLSYAPPAIASGTLTVNFGYSDATGAFNTGAVNINYAATTNNNVVGTPVPSGEIDAIVGEADPAVAVTFTTDDGRPATALQLTSDLTSLPAGWSSTMSSFACSGVSSGTACQLPLVYTPLAAASGSLTLNYAYVSNAGVAKTASLNIAYRATADDTVIGTPSEAPLSVPVGGSAPLTITFATDDANPASNLTVTSGLETLPAGWSGPASFTCSSVSAGSPCELALTYAPAAADAGTVTLGFSYVNDAGVTKSGTVAVAYSAM